MTGQTKRQGAGELLYGNRAISEFLGITPRQSSYLIEKGALPVWHEGKTLMARRATLLAWVDEREASSTKAAQ